MLVKQVVLSDLGVEEARLDVVRSVTAVLHGTELLSDVGIVLGDQVQQLLDDVDLVTGDQVDRNSVVTLNSLEIHPAALIVNKRDGDSGTSKTSGTANPVKVGNEVGGFIHQTREIVVDDQRGRGDVDTAGNQVGGDQNL
jgi:hypothetical protein